MKKSLVIVLILMLVLSCVVFAGCGEGNNAPAADSKYIGTWQAVKATFMGEESDMSEVLGGDELKLILNADGTGTLESSEETSEFTWSETSDGFKVKGDDVDMKFKDEDGVVSSSMLGVDLIFEKID